MRAFLAVGIPADLRKYLRNVMDRMAVRVKGIRWVREDGLHITLRFLGEIDHETAGMIGDGISSIGTGYAPFSATIGAMDAFPNRKRARVVVVGIEEGAETIKRIYGDVERGLSRLGIEPEGREYSPHITLGRAKVPAPLLEKDMETLERRRFPVERVTLFESTLTREGALYTPRWDIKLGG